MKTTIDALVEALEALETIALAGMSGSGQESEEGMRAWHARRAWEFIGIAARAKEKVTAALALARAEQAEPQPEKDGPIVDGWQLTVADGHSGHGVYAHMTEYPDEGAVLVLPITPRAEQAEPVRGYGNLWPNGNPSRGDLSPEEDCHAAAIRANAPKVTT